MLNLTGPAYRIIGSWIAIFVRYWKVGQLAVCVCVATLHKHVGEQRLEGS